MKLLLVDDSKAMRLIVRRTLREAGFDGAEITEKANGKEALEFLRDNKVDLVLSDWNMPEMTGIELLKSLNEEKIHVKFGFVTSEGSEDIRGEGSSHGALFLIVKPFAAETFRKVISPHIAGV